MPEVRLARVERATILELRAQVLGTQGRSSAALPNDLSPSTRHWAALSGSRVVGCASVMRIRGWALRGVAVAPELRRQGIGALLVEAVCAEVDAAMWCHARLAATPFFAHLGWQSVGPVFELRALGPHQRMTWSPGRSPQG